MYSYVRFVNLADMQRAAVGRYNEVKVQLLHHHYEL